MRNLPALLTALFLLSARVLFAQGTEVTGKITDTEGQPVPGATIRIEGTRSGVQALVDGSFKTPVKAGAKLTVSAIGFETKEVIAAENMTITLTRDVKGMNEVVVTVIGIRREKRELATATQTINADQINKSGTGNTLSELNGKASGLTVINSSGAREAAPISGCGALLPLRETTSP